MPRLNDSVIANGLLTRRALLVSSLGMAMATATGCLQSTSLDGVYLSQPAGTPGVRVGGPGGAPVWSPVGNEIVWGTEDGIFSSKPAGAAPVLIWEAPIAGKPGWSPDGNRLAFFDRTRNELVVLDVNAREVQFTVPAANPNVPTSTVGVVSAGGPAWSPDGEWIAFNCWDGAGDEVCSVSQDGLERRQLTEIRPLLPGRNSAAAAHVGPPSWAPDGKFLSVGCFAERSGAPSGIFVVDLALGQARRVSSLVPSSEIVWYPDGNSVAFAARRNNRVDVYQLIIKSGLVNALTADLPGNCWDPALGPRARDLAVADADGIVILNQDTWRVISQASGLRAANPAWSPDGESLAYRGVPDSIASYN